MNHSNRSTLRHALASGLALACAAVHAAPADAIPVYCFNSVGVSGESILACRRADTRASVTPVPPGYYLHITDIVVNPNNIATAGTFTASLGLDNAGAFPSTPLVDLIGSPAQQLHFTNPYLVFESGEQISVANNSSSAFPIDVRLAGYLSTIVAP
jgi:hypothetical protein